MRPLVNGQVHELFARQRDGATISRYQADHHIEAGGFTRTIRPQQPNYLASSYVERYVFNDSALTLNLA